MGGRCEFCGVTNVFFFSAGMENCLKLIVNGEFVCCEAAVFESGKGNGGHVVVLPVRFGAKVVFETGGNCMEFDAPFEAPISLEWESWFEISYVEKRRTVDTCLSDALECAVKVLQRDEAYVPKIGAIKFEDISAILAKHIGEDRAKARFSDDSWISGFAEISSFTSKDCELSCVVRKGANKCPHAVSETDNHDALFAVGLLHHEGEADSSMGRKIAASFSTMMRYFQKAKSDFSWASCTDSKTVIRLAAA